MKYKSLEEKLELYYNKVKNPSKIINNWAIIDIDAFKTLHKLTIISINNISHGETDRIITTETKNKYLIIKYSPSFIATKVIDTEYDYLIKDWELIAVDRDTIYKENISKIISNKEIMKLLGFKLNKKARLDLDYFG
ncbi:MAG: hypothetical protein EBT04_15770, partial [Betaproteobacteria bacterium]|nr:hypothetical protein [Betaproteobacteria bacterium]